MISRSRSGSRASMNRIQILTCSVVLCVLALGCGGGGGGGGGGGQNNVIYSGLSTPAMITENNANTIAGSALETRSTAAAFSGIASLDGKGQVVGESYQPFLTGVSNAMKGAIEQVDFGAAPELYVPAAIETDADVIAGACGGNASYSVNVNTETGNFSGSISFRGFCGDGVSLSGPANFSGVINPNTLELESFTFTFDYVTGTSATQSYTLDGRIDYIQSGATTIGTMNMAVQDNNRGRVCLVESYQLVITDGYGQVEIEISGKFYDPDYGYVDLETETALMVSDADDYPNSGVVILTGDIGSAGGPTMARLTALSRTQCQVEADTNGDGSYDYDSGPVSWTDLDNAI